MIPTPMHYPYVGRHIVDRNLVVLFVNPGAGYCIRNDSRGTNRLNIFQADWVERNFEHYDWGRDRSLSQDEFRYFYARAQEHGVITDTAA